LNTATFSRYFTVQNVCRATSTNNITGVSDSGGTSTTTCVTSGGNIDPSTELVTVTVSSNGITPLVLPEYITRWRNEVCVQQSWSGSISTSTVSATSSCQSPSPYQSETDVTASSSGLQLCQGSC
jgi:hypothetical protein